MHWTGKGDERISGQALTQTQNLLQKFEGRDHKGRKRKCFLKNLSLALPGLGFDQKQKPQKNSELSS